MESEYIFDGAEPYPEFRDFVRAIVDADRQYVSFAHSEDDALDRADAEMIVAAVNAREFGTNPVAYARRDTLLNWQGQLVNVAWMFPSPVGLKDPIALFAWPQAATNDAALQSAAKAVEAIGDVWTGFSMQDAKVCVNAYLAVAGAKR